MDNYRGVAILPTVGKLFESIVCSILKIEFKAIITAFQHGFFTGRSTSTNLVSFTNYAVDTIESGAQLDVIYTDFSKAFDRISHKLLLRKLSDIGVHSSLLKWIQSYLEDRRQFVKIGDFVSYTFDMCVPASHKEVI